MTDTSNVRMPHFTTRFLPSSCFSRQIFHARITGVPLSPYHEGDDEDEGQREADDEGDDAHHEERVRSAIVGPVGVGGGRRPEEGGVQDEGAVGHEQEAREDRDDQRGLLGGLTTTV